MADVREEILARLLVVCAGVTGIAGAIRNQLDLAYNARPGVAVLDGSEQLLDAANGARFSEVQRMELSPQITLLVRADNGSEAGALMTLYRGRIVSAVLSDATLRGYVGRTGGIRYEGCSVPEPTPETKEPRMDISIVFTYPFRVSDLSS